MAMRVNQGFRLPAMCRQPPLLVLTVGFVIVSAVLCRTWYGGQEYAYEQLFSHCSGVSRALCMLLGIGMAVVSVLGLVYLPAQLLEESTIMGDQLIAPSMVIVCATGITWALGLLTGIGPAAARSGK